MGVLVRGGRIVTSSEEYAGDIRIEGEKIIAIGEGIEEEGDQIIDATGCYVFPGGIDTHTHFDLDVGTTVTADDFNSGTRAAIAGGTTTILDYAAQNRGETLREALRGQHRKAEGKCYCDYGFHMGITDWNDTVSKEMKDMVEEGVSSFKLYMAYKGKLQVDDGVIYEALKRSVEVGGLIGFHCENGDIIDRLIISARVKGRSAPVYHALTRPSELEAEAVERVINIADFVKAPVYIVHLSTRQGLLNVIEGKKRGVEVYGETCPQYLLLDESLYGKDDGSFEGAKYVMSPPLRKHEDQEALWEGIKNNQISTIGTDHCSFNFKGQKDIGILDFTKIPNGGPGVEHRMELLYSFGVLKGRINMKQFVALTSTNAAKLFGIFPQKGDVSVGSDGDLTILDPMQYHIIQRREQVQNVDYTPYEGFEVKGKIRQVLLRGKLVVDNSKVIPQEPQGKYLKRGICPGR